MNSQENGWVSFHAHPPRKEPGMWVESTCGKWWVQRSHGLENLGMEPTGGRKLASLPDKEWGHRECDTGIPGHPARSSHSPRRLCFPFTCSLHHCYYSWERPHPRPWAGQPAHTISSSAPTPAGGESLLSTACGSALQAAATLWISAERYIERRSVLWFVFTLCFYFTLYFLIYF